MEPPLRILNTGPNKSPGDSIWGRGGGGLRRRRKGVGGGPHTPRRRWPPRGPPSRRHTPPSARCASRGPSPGWSGTSLGVWGGGWSRGRPAPLEIVFEAQIGQGKKSNDDCEEMFTQSTEQGTKNFNGMLYHLKQDWPRNCP